jgi:hypothetical protein
MDTGTAPCPYPRVMASRRGSTKCSSLQAFSLRPFDERAARLLPENALWPPTQTTEHAILQEKGRDGSDGTRTRDLRRDRPRHGIRQVSRSDGE